ncbi:HU family DNA-binding protein [Blochmannia endosymbiont of Camponotus (Colobopsis) obliquus]|uniref:HU family DNA-binding protein n=1 Tax=Blochmannia endosymbiont of Camponotus (Colobopsis) obliquus TaxID=1505597 RepID=UPI00061A540D|nr:HU family DNA-binding protein [Blochmannia endosymbiont of Camponotus (Colobopsis) obliquus]AKC60700.1 DNA-binding protein HU-alpha [Blochmannia endosymbiont of Camponotus (Colobopsis) obliquus]
MNKTQMIDVIVNEHSISKVQVKLVLETILSEIIASLKLGNTVKLVGFGVFKVKNLQTRIGYNLQTGKRMKILSSKVPTFVFSRSVKKIIN